MRRGRKNNLPPGNSQQMAAGCGDDGGVWNYTENKIREEQEAPCDWNTGC